MGYQNTKSNFSCIYRYTSCVPKIDLFPKNDFSERLTSNH